MEEKLSAAEKLFGKSTAGGKTFLDHLAVFKAMFYINIREGYGWYLRSRLWNAVYLQRRDGSVAPSADLAHILFARNSGEKDLEVDPK